MNPPPRRRRPGGDSVRSSPTRTHRRAHIVWISLTSCLRLPEPAVRLMRLGETTLALGDAAVCPPGCEEDEQGADAGDDAELHTLKFPEAARRLIDGGHVDVRAERVRLRADVLCVRE